MTTSRAERVARQLRKEISSILQNELKDPRIKGMPSIVSVKVTRDLSHARVFVSIYGTQEDKSQTLEALEKAKGFVRTELAQRIRLRYMPELYFEEDTSIAYGMHINAIFVVCAPAF